jgi:sugar lactone lactonase YvrE
LLAATYAGLPLFLGKAELLSSKLVLRLIKGEKMSPLRISVSALAIVSITPLLTACASHSAPGAPISLIPSALTSSALVSDGHVRPRPKFLYVSNCCVRYKKYKAVINVYNAQSEKNPPPVAAIKIGPTGAEGLCTDAAGNLYVVSASGNSVTVYPKGRIKPSVVYTQDLSFPQADAVDSHGTLYVTSSTNNLIVEYPKGSTTPSLTFSPAQGFAVGLTLDKQDNLYVTANGSSAIWRYAPGSTKGQALPYKVPGSYPNLIGVAIDDKGRVFVGDASNNSIYGFSGTSSTPFETITQGLNYEYFFGFGPDGNLYVPNPGANTVTVYAPNNPSVMSTFSENMATPGGVAFLNVK